MKIIFTLLVFFTLTGCAGIMPPAERLMLANDIATAHALKPLKLDTRPPLYAYQRPQAPDQEHVRLYIEGDGFAYVTSSVPSPDPTPIEPTTLRLAAADDSPNVIYLARPCHYTKLKSNPDCPQKYWTTHRYSRETVDIYHNVLNTLKKQHNVQSFDLVGYSGGGVIAALLAAEREDVTALRTVASNLDVAAFINHHGVSAMPHSLNPATHHQEKLAHLPQRHFVGGEDDIVPAKVLRSYLEKINGDQDALTVVREMNHFSPWHKKWQNLVAKPLQHMNK